VSSAAYHDGGNVTEHGTSMPFGSLERGKMTPGEMAHSNVEISTERAAAL
jgi:hypothetical protein